ncbi:MAG TPA: hypothetical protein VGO59_03890 [Verrucomicrobiae bacterium]
MEPRFGHDFSKVRMAPLPFRKLFRKKRV